MPVYGDCLSTNGFEEVSIASLRETSCEVIFSSSDAPEDLVLTIWIGAIGPITGRIKTRRGCVVTLEFDEQMDERLVRHFACV
jgi:hypothetical protein